MNVFAGRINSTPATLVASYSIISTASNDTSRTSQILTLTGLPKINGSTSQTDMFVLQMSATEASGPIHLGWFEPGSNMWVSAVSGNIGGTPVFAGDRPYNPTTDFILGLHGYDSTSKTAWAVINHNSDFSIQRGDPVTTPTALFTAAVTTAGLIGPNALPGATPFNDDVENLLKYAFNMNLGAADVHRMAEGENSGLPLISAIPNGLRFEYLRRVGSGLIYTPRWSSTLQEGSCAVVTGIPEISYVNSVWERVVVTQAMNAEAVTRCFGIVVVTLP
jgi:hypothetical protein